MQIVVKQKDVIMAPAKPVDLTAMPAERTIELLRKAYAFTATNMSFEIRHETVAITVDYERREAETTARDCFDRGMRQACRAPRCFRSPPSTPGRRTGSKPVPKTRARSEDEEPDFHR